MNADVAGDEQSVAVACRFVRGHNALLCEGDFGPIFVDLYLQLGQNGVVLEGGLDEQLKHLVAALVLHAASRPHDETCAWTVHFDESPGLNLFAVAENPTGRVTGRVLTEDVRKTGADVLLAETAVPGRSPRRSSVEFTGRDVLRAVDAFYARSEQRMARLFQLGGDRFALLAAQPDCNEEWLAVVDPEEVLRLADDVSRPPMETRFYRWECGCSPEKIASAIGPALSGDLDGVFAGDDFIRVNCPRCGTRHEIGRGEFEKQS